MKHSQQTHGWYRYTRGYHLVVIALALLSACFLLFTAVTPASALTSVPTKMNFQGRLTDASGNIKPNGTYNMRLKLYTVSTAGSAVWSEDRLVSATQGVTVTNGLFSIQLGSITTLPASLFASGQLYLEVELPTPATATSASPVWTEGPMTPRNQMATSAYAYNAETIDGIDSANLAQLDQNNTFSGNNIFTGTIQGNSSLTLGTASAQGSLVVHDGNGQTATIRVADTAGSYTYTLPVTTANDTFCLQTLANCGGAGSGVTTVGTYSTTNTSATGATISGTTITFQDASATAPGMVGIGTQTFAGNKTFNGTLSVNDVSLAAGKSLTVTGGATGTRPASPTEGMVYYDTTTKQLLTYANGKWQADRTEAIIVAASNSSQADKDAADYVADGNTVAAADGDQVQINAALTAGSGKKVVLLAGTYVADATILIPNNTTLAGIGQGTVIELADLDATDNLIENSDTTTGQGVVIKDMVISGRKDLNTVGTQYGIYTTGTLQSDVQSNVIIEDVVVKDTRNFGIYLANGRKHTLQGVYTSGNTGGGASITGQDSIISNSSFDGNGLTAAYNLAVYGNNTKITSNRFTYGVSSYGQLYLASGSITGVQISGNTFRDSSGWSIVMTAGSTKNNISSNNFINNAGGAIRLNTSPSNTIANNVITNSGGATTNNAIYLDDSDSNTIISNSITDSSATTNNYAINISNTISDTNYLADNTLGGGSINDAGTGTIYGGQVDASGNYAIQPAGSILLNKNTTVSAGSLTLGNATTAGALVVSDGSSNTATIVVANLAGNYTYTIPVTTANDTFCLQTLANCGGGSGVTAVGALDGGTANANGATISGTTVYLQSASASFAGLVNTTTQTFAGNKTFSGTLAVSSTSTFTGTLTVGSGGNTVTLGTTGLSLAGTARGTQRIMLTAEYAGAVLDAGSGANNTGSMTGGVNVTNRMNYYKWTTTQGTNQNYDVVLQVPIPADFDAWASSTPINISTYSSDLTNGTVTFELRDSTNAVIQNFVSVTPTATTTWQTKNPGTVTGTYTAGDYLTIRIRMQSPNAGDVRIGNLYMDYRSKF